MYILFFFLFSACFWGLFVYAFHKDRSRYRNGYLLFLALLSMIPFLLSVFREQMGYVVLLFQAGLIALLIVPFFLIHNGIVMIRREGRYLLEKGIPESDIILEDASKTTLENLKFSKQILDGIDGRKNTALVTSNYHVYRALRYCRKIGLKCTGIGSRVAFYYWPSALIREFIAIHTEKKHAVMFIAGWLICVLCLLAVIVA